MMDLKSRKKTVIVDSVARNSRRLAILDRADKSRAALSNVTVGWLIEHESEPKWFTLRPVDVATERFWTQESNDALRFCRREDADNFVAAHFCVDAPICITEHMWVRNDAAGAQ
jgi:hypothetical protein